MRDASRLATKGSLQRCLQILLFLIYFTGVTEAGVSCDSDQFCQDLYSTSDSVCLSATKECSNPFQKGCLRVKGIKTEKTDYTDAPRVCTSVEEIVSATSDDGAKADQTNCKTPDFPYPEIRIHNGDWTSSFVLAWIYQIVLVEILGVPAAVGMTTERTKTAGFYSANNSFPFSVTNYPYDALKVANAQMLSGGNCENTEEACVHVLPEVWNAQQDRWLALEKEGAIDRALANGIVYKPSLMIPKKTAEENPSLGLFYGLQGAQNRQLVAQTFKKPTTWVEYCEIVSPNNCSLADSTTTRYPTEDEKSMYFLEGSYQGYFRETDKNKCNASRSLDDCHGYIIGPPCFRSAFVEAQIYWNNIGLKLDGPEGSIKGYRYTSLTEIWKAANATGSDVIVWWYMASLEAQSFGQNSSYSPQMIQLPHPSKECLENRLTQEERCSEDQLTRLGSSLGSCDQEYSQLRRLMASSVNQLNSAAPPYDQSPALEMLTALQISEYDMIEILRAMLTGGEDQAQNNARAAVCNWVASHIEELEELVPDGFPKRLTSAFDFGISHYLAQAMAIFVGVLSFLCIVLTLKFRDTKTMTFAQPSFLVLIMIGLCLVCLAAFLLAVVPEDHVCLSIKWLEVVGFGIQLIPVMIKTSALNRLISSSKKQQRININRKTLMRKVSGWMFLIIICMLAWTLTDPPRVTAFRSLSIEDPYLVAIDRECTSDNLYWEVVQSAMELALLFICAILAFQSRNAISVVNDSRVLAQLVYSHFLFVILRVVITGLDLSDLFSGDIIPILASFAHSCDSLFALCIYIVPKIILAKYEEPNFRAKLPGQYSSARLKVDKNVKVLVCTANMGNAEPTRESMEAWLPPDGACYSVTPLSNAHRELKKGYFDIVVIGMQESTWARKETKKLSAREGSKENAISEEDILNALDQHDSATLRVMVQDILGSEYLQIVEEQRGQMRLSIWASANVEEHIKQVRISGANTGIGNVLANKGGIVATFNYKTTRLTFITAHLAAHEGDNYYRNRLANIRSILKEGKTSELSSKLDITMMSHHMFLLGDLNFRTKFEDADLPHEKCVQRAMNLVDFKDYEGLYMYDELQQGLRNGELLHGWKTLPCDFPPTFKVQREPGYVYKKQRTPSYTDRIIYNSIDGFQSHIEQLAYEPCVDFVTSDHKPVRGAFSILPTDEIKPRIIQGKFILKLARIQASDLPVSDSSGKADPYVMLMWEGVDFAVQNMSLRDRLSKYYNGQFWPRTKHKSRTLDPFWEDEEIHVEAENPMIRKGSFLHVVVVDRDQFGSDDFMCAGTLSLWDFCNHGTITHDLDIPLFREGMKAGNIKFKMYVGIPERATRPVGAVRRASLTLNRFVNMFDQSTRGDEDDNLAPQPGLFSSKERAAPATPQNWKTQISEQESREVLNALYDEAGSSEEIAENERVGEVEPPNPPPTKTS